VEVAPKTIKLAGQPGALTIEWSDGHLSTYPYSYLRDKCPCATCSELGSPGSATPSPFPILGARPLEPERAELVGRYALQIYWSDGHSSGIYSFDYLRLSCPCPACTAEGQCS